MHQSRDGTIHWRRGMNVKYIANPLYVLGFAHASSLPRIGPEYGKKFSSALTHRPKVRYSRTGNLSFCPKIRYNRTGNSPKSPPKIRYSGQTLGVVSGVLCQARKKKFDTPLNGWFEAFWDLPSPLHLPPDVWLSSSLLIPLFLVIFTDDSHLFVTPVT